jgi:hypothetical protein
MELIDVVDQQARYFTRAPSYGGYSWWTPSPEVMDSFFANRASPVEGRAHCRYLEVSQRTLDEKNGFYLPEEGYWFREPPFKSIQETFR